MAKTATAEKEAKKTTKKKATVKKAAKTGKKYLVIVESPAKAATIGKFLGNNYKIEASMGHVRDMPKSQMGIDFEHDFEPKYITIRGKGELLGKLRKDAKAADKVYLATDPDVRGKPSAGICFTRSIWVRKNPSAVLRLTKSRKRQ